MKLNLLFIYLTTAICLIGCGKSGGGVTDETPVSQNRLVISDLEYTSLTNSFALDTSLKLSVKKKYRISGRVSYRDLDMHIYSDNLTGDYLLTASLIPFESGLDNSDVYSASEQRKVHIEEGVLNTTVELTFDFSQLPLLVSPSQLLIQLDPLSTEFPRGISLAAKFDNFSSSGRLPMERLTVPAQQIIDSYLRDKENRTSLSAESKRAFADSLHLRPFDLQALSGIGMIETEYEALITALLEKKNVSVEQARKFCAWIFPYPSLEWRQCVLSPGQMISLFASRHVKKIVGEPKIQSVDSYFVQLSDFKFTENTSSEEQYAGTRDTKFMFNLTSVAGKVEAKLGINIFGSGVDASTSLINETGVRFGKEWFSVHQHIDRSTKEGIRKSYSKNRNLQVQEWHLKFNAEMDRCLTIVAKSSGREGVQLCKPDSNHTVTERWFFLNQSAFNAGAPMPINNNSNERLLSVAVRGQDNFDEMMSLFSSDSEIVFQKTNFVNSPLIDGSFPGVITR
jgi:hypothetical protein